MTHVADLLSLPTFPAMHLRNSNRNIILYSWYIYTQEFQVISHAGKVTSKRVSHTLLMGMYIGTTLFKRYGVSLEHEKKKKEPSDD